MSPQFGEPLGATWEQFACIAQNCFLYLGFGVSYPVNAKSLVNYVCNDLEGKYETLKQFTLLLEEYPQTSKHLSNLNGFFSVTVLLFPDEKAHLPKSSSGYNPRK